MDNFNQIMQLLTQMGGTESTDNPNIPTNDPGESEEFETQDMGPQTTGDSAENEANVVSALLSGTQISLPANTTLDFSFLPEEVRSALSEVIDNAYGPGQEEQETPEEESAESPEEEALEDQEGSEQQPPPPTETSPMTTGQAPPPETTGPVELHAAPLTKNKSKEEDKNSKSSKKEPPKKK